MPLTIGSDLINSFRNEATACGALSEAINIHSAHDLGSLKKLQRSAGNCAKGKLHTQLLQKYEVQLDDETTRVQVQEHLARVDATMKSALRFILGVSPGPRQHSPFTSHVTIRAVTVTTL